MFDAHILI